jgi:hypothetical protein
LDAAIKGSCLGKAATPFFDSRLSEMMMDDEKVELSATEARAGTTPHIVRYVLIISLALAVVAMGIVLASAS